MEAKKAPVDRQANVIEILEILIALKKVNQCKAIINPAKNKSNNSFFCNFNGIFL